MNLPGYDEWKMTPPDESEPKAHCYCCEKPLYEGDVLYTVDGGICEVCLNENYKSFVQEEQGMKYWTCPKCGANLDHGEKCDCEECKDGKR